MIVQAEGVTEPSYLPTLAEIRERCRRIQKTWSAKERRKRAGGLVSGRWEAPGVVGVDADFFAATEHFW